MENQLAKYKRENHPVRWEKLVKKTGLSVQALIRISHLKIQDIPRIKLKTYLTIKSRLGVDLLKQK